MNHHSLSKPEPLLPELRAELERVRTERLFQPETYITAKMHRLFDYLWRHDIKAVVVGLSGGIDSAVVLGLLLELKKRFPDGPLQRIVPVAMPVHVTAATGQAAAENRAGHLCVKWGIPLMVYDMVKVHAAYREAIDWIAPKDEWASGQLVSYLRTPALYYTTSLLNAAGTRAVVVGTTNRDEGAYLGYVGKASDGMVDIQLIADLHKSEVRAVARVLGVTQEIMDVAPSGDMFDGRVDEEVFGAPYDFVEMYLAHKSSFIPVRARFFMNWSKEAHDQYARFAESLETLHTFNAHKYLVGSPAVHLNVQESAVPGGWRE